MKRFWFQTYSSAVLALLVTTGAACTVVEEVPDDAVEQVDISISSDVETPDDAALDMVAGDVPLPPEDVGPDLADTNAQDMAQADTGPEIADEDVAQADIPEADIPEEDVADDVAVEDAVVADATTGPCETPLGITPASLFVEPLQFLVFNGRGGSGVYRFELGTNESGASIHPLFGTFVAGLRSGAVVVRVSDVTCGGKVEAIVTVTEPVQLLPRAADIEPARGQLQLVVVGGSGQNVFEVQTFGSSVVPASELSATGLLIAGAREETLVVRMTDTGTGAMRTAQVQVKAGSTLQVEPGHLTLPLGERWKMRLAGGSKRVDVRLVTGGAVGPDGQPTLDSIVAFEDGWIEALRAGRATLRIQDLHTSEIISFSVDIVDAPYLEMFPAGDGKVSGVTHVEDLDGDGFPEVVFGMPEADIGGYDAGAVFIHRGTEDGFEVDPAVVLTVPGRLDEFGNALTVGDIDGDGYPELVVGASLSDEMGTDRGNVQVFQGHPTELFAVDPIAVFIGENVSDTLGGAVALCDFNGDGRLDLAMSARLAEDENQTPVVANTGAVYIHLGYINGFQRAPDQIIWGVVPQRDGTIRAQSGLAFGRAMAVGDVDGDGLCDLGVTAVGYAFDSSRINDGAAYVYRGRGPDSFGPGGLESDPSLAILGDEPEVAGQLGTSLAMGDIDGDGLADLLVGQPEITRRVGTSARAANGSAIIWRGVDIPTAGTRVASLLEAPFRYFGRDGVSEASDRFGWAVAIGDFDGVPPLDVFVGARLDEQAPCLSNCGTVHVVQGVDGGLPSSLGPHHVYAGDVPNQNFGSVFAVAPDFDGDGLAEIVGRLPLDDRITPRLGMHAVRSSIPEAPFVGLSFPANSAGSRFGSALAVIADLDGDGFPEVAAGAWRAQVDPSPTAQYRPGEVALFRGTAQGVASQPFQRLSGFANHTIGDAFGHAVVSVADFNGDGRSEVAVVSRLDDTGAACSPARNDAGAVYLFSAQTDGSVAATPMAALWGPQASQQIQAIESADINGDGLADVILGGPSWDRPPTFAGTDNGGGIGIYLGDNTITATGNMVNRCSPNHILFGAAIGDVFGTTIQSLGDLNDDGCDDLAVSAILGDPPGATNAGYVYVVYGFGANCAFETAHAIVLSPGAANAQAGGALAAADINGDGLSELAIGGRRWTNGTEAVGAVWMVNGAWMRQLAASALPWVDAEPPRPVWNVTAPGQPMARVTGVRRDEDFGRSLALIAGSGFENAWLAVGRPLSDVSGVDGAGVVSVYEVRLASNTFTFGAVPAVAIGGETNRIRSEFGFNLVGWRSPAGRSIAVGAGLSSAVGLDDGAFFVTRPR